MLLLLRENKNIMKVILFLLIIWTTIRTKLSSNYLFTTKIKHELNIVPHLVAVIGEEEEHP
jgi:hypothetical protein